MLLLGGCFSLSRDAPPVREYVLGGRPAPTAPVTRTESPVNGAARTVGLRRADVAAYLRSAAIVLRRGEHEVIASPFHRWREPLDQAIDRVVATHLQTQAPVRAVDIAPWDARTRHDVWVQLRVRQFEGVLGDGVSPPHTRLDADWDVVRPLDGRVLVRGHTRRTSGVWAAGDYQSLVRALDADLAALAHDLADCLGRFRNDTTPPASCGPVASIPDR
jgi:uncharacterized lipoprotein YmbA